MRWLGRIVAAVFLLWFGVILLGALGVGPAGRLPLGNALRPSAGPPPLRRVPAAQPPTRSDLVPALSAAVFNARVRAHLKQQANGGANATTTTHGHSATAPGHANATTTTRGHSATAPGHAKTTTTTRGRSGTAPGHTTTTTATTTTTPAHGHRRP